MNSLKAEIIFAIGQVISPIISKYLSCFGTLQLKYDKKISPVIDLQKIVCQRLDYIEDFLDQNFGKEEDEEERIIN